MAKKVIKKRASTKKTKNPSIEKKVINKSTEDNSSTGIMLLAGIGLILLIYFGSNVSADITIDSKEKKTESLLQNGFTLNNKTYSSRVAAKEVLTRLPQTQLSNEEIEFVEGYQE